MGRIYPTKVDWWISLILIFTVAVLIGSAVPFFIGPPAQSPLGLGIGILCLAIAVWIGWRCQRPCRQGDYYRIDRKRTWL